MNEENVICSGCGKQIKENEGWFSCEYQNHNEDWHNSCAFKEVEE